MKLAEVFVELRIDDRRAKAETQQKAKSLGTIFAQMFGAAAFGAGVKKAIDQASAFEQSLGAIESVLGRNAKAVQRWAETAAKSMGLSKTAANNALALMSAQLKNFGFSLDDATDKGMDLVALGADLAATYGGSTTDAVQALTAAFRGEMDPIERYAISLNEARLKAKALELGLYDGVGALDMNTKAQAVLALVTEQSASTQGQFARESHTAAGATAIAAAEAENASISFGDKLLPVYTRVMEVVGGVAEAFGLLPAPMQYAVIGLVAYAALSGPISSVGSAIQAATLRVQAMGNASKALVGIAGLAGLALVALSIRAKQAAEAEREIADAIGELNRAAEDQLWATFAEAFATAILHGKPVVELYEDMAEANLEGTKRLRDWLAAQDEAGTANEGQRQILASLTDAINEEERARAQAASTQEEYADGIDTTNTKADELTDTINELEAAFTGLIGALDVRDAARDASEGFDKITEAYEAIYDATDKRPLDEKIRDWQQAIDDQKRSVIDWATEMGNVPASTVTDIMALIDEGSFEEAERRIAALTARRNLVIDAKQIQTPYAANNATLNKFDRGGYIDRDQVAMIHRNEVVLPLNNPGRVAALLGDPRVAPSVAGVLGGGGQGGPSLSIGSLSVGSRDDLGATTNELGRLLWRVS